MIEELLDLAAILGSIGGGAFGAAIGPLPAFVFTGFMVIAGEASVLAGGDGSITGAVAFGPAFSPAVSFAGGVAATAYAARRGYMDEFEFDFHQGKNIAQALGTKPDVLAVGAAFGVLGYWLQTASAELAMPYDPIAMGVVLSAIFHRLILGYSIIGTVRGSSILDMTPFERDEKRTATDGGEPSESRRTSEDDESSGSERSEGPRSSSERRSDGGEVAEEGESLEAGAAAMSSGETGRLAVEPWLPHQYLWGHVAAIGAVAGLLGAWVAIETGSPFLAFGISAASLLFLNLGIEWIPVTHHITLPGGTAAMAVALEADHAVIDGAPVAYESGAALAGVDPAIALLVGLVVGVLCALFGELFQRVFYAHGDTHVDPPAAAIVFGTFLVAIGYAAGVLPTTVWVPFF